MKLEGKFKFLFNINVFKNKYYSKKVERNVVRGKQKLVRIIKPILTYGMKNIWKLQMCIRFNTKTYCLFWATHDPFPLTLNEHDVK